MPVYPQKEKGYRERINVTVPLLDDEDEHLTRLADLTGLKRYQVMRQALLAFSPAMADYGWLRSSKLKRENMIWETLKALEVAGGNKRVAADILDISPTGVTSRIQRFGLKVKSNRVGRPSKQDLAQLKRTFNEQRTLRLFGRQQAGSGDSGAEGGSDAAPEG